MPVHIPPCHHFKTNGVFCGSPALRGHRYCYFHHRWRERRPKAQPIAKPAPFELPLLEDAEAVQLALQRVMQAILNDQIDTRKAGLLLYALQTASSNLKNTHFDHPALDTQARAEYANADSNEDDDEDACEICFDDEEEEDDEEENEEEDTEEENEERDGEQANEKEDEKEQQPAAQQAVTVTAAAQSPAAQSPARPAKVPPKQPPRTSPLPEQDEELDDQELIKAIRQLAGLT